MYSFRAGTNAPAKSHENAIIAALSPKVFLRDAVNNTLASDAYQIREAAHVLGLSREDSVTMSQRECRVPDVRYARLIDPAAEIGTK